MWKMSKSRKSNASLLGVRDGALQCGGGGTCSWSVRELSADKIEERVRGEGEEEEEEEGLEEKSNTKFVSFYHIFCQRFPFLTPPFPFQRLEEFFKKGKREKVKRTATPPPKEKVGFLLPVPSWNYPIITYSPQGESNRTPPHSPPFPGMIPPPFSQSNRTATSPPAFTSSVDSLCFPKRVPKNLSFSLDPTLIEGKKEIKKVEEDREKLYSVLKATMLALGMKQQEIQNQISQIHCATDSSRYQIVGTTIP